MPIWLADPDKTYIVARITGNDKVRAHLTGLGFVEGAEVSVVAKTTSGVIVKVLDSRVALGRDLANRVFV